MSGVPVSSVDVVAVGGGVAGCALAAVLAEAGMAVLVLERETVFRDRVRGEWIPPWGVSELDETVSGTSLRACRTRTGLSGRRRSTRRCPWRSRART